MIRLVANLDMYTPLSAVAEAARRAERLGFDRLSIPDACHDGLVAAGVAAGATSRIGIANSALVCFPRSPMTTAVAVWDLQELSSGRYVLGLGPLIAPNIIQKYSTPWHPPAPRMREYVQAMRAIFRSWQHGEELRFEGTYYRFTRQQRYMMPRPIAHPDIALQLAAVGPKMSTLGGEIADAVNLHPTNTDPRFIRELLRPDLARGAERAARSVDEVRVIANPFIATGRTRAEIDTSRSEHRALLATLLSTPNYWRSLELHGWGELGPILRERVREGRWQDMADLLTDQILDAFVVSAHQDEMPALLRERYAGLADAIGVNFTSAQPDAFYARLVEGLS